MSLNSLPVFYHDFLLTACLLVPRREYRGFKHTWKFVKQTSKQISKQIKKGVDKFFLNEILYLQRIFFKTSFLFPSGVALCMSRCLLVSLLNKYQLKNVLWAFLWQKRIIQLTRAFVGQYITLGVPVSMGKLKRANESWPVFPSQGLKQAQQQKRTLPSGFEEIFSFAVGFLWIISRKSQSKSFIKNRLLNLELIIASITPQTIFTSLSIECLMYLIYIFICTYI